MPGYIGLYKRLPKGVANITEAPRRIQQGVALAESMGIRAVGVWNTMGAFDLVAVWDAPDEQTMSAFHLELARLGNVTTQTLRAFSEEEFAEIVAKLP